MTRFDIWSEGFRATGESGTATYHGTVRGETFRDACRVYFAAHRDGHLFDEARLTYWGCRLFDNATDARRSYG